MSNTVKSFPCETCRVRHKGIFADLESHNLSEISTKKGCQVFSKGELIFQENQYPQGLYAIYQGKVKVFKTTESGKDHIFRLASEGDVLGYRSLISGEAYEVSAIPLVDTRVCFIPKQVFMSVLQESTNLTGQVMNLLSHDLRFAEEKLTKMAQKTVKERLAETLLMLKQYYGQEADDTGFINILLSREDLANLVGTATETLIRALSDFKKEGLVDLQGKKIAILDVKRLDRMTKNFD
ncbi:Crp/Fnr family transcriptional regulator [Eisenibacter elegans]|jgi:CRP/FNR family transcriptional regulator|uniref:Crp/Fnr family transcriptional regulator n=1 Tax=Eisenibacter elegans TaxID=997 RepID=UPI000412754B|nr:Crp/Fnr family transcriptional regulator [Eisenibacter elegans]